MRCLEEEILDLFTQQKMTLSTAESCTGGGVGGRLTGIPNASTYFLGGIIAYSNFAKTNLLNVTEKTLQEEGAVSEKTALEMALGAKKAFQSDCALAVTGIAGPTGGSPEKPVGMVCFAIVSNKEQIAWTAYFSGSREKITLAAALEVLFRIKCFLS